MTLPFQTALPPIEPLGEGPLLPAGPREGWHPLNKHGPCFVCQRDNPGGLRADLYRDGDVIRSVFEFPGHCEGPPGHAHGGSSAAFLDEMMGAAAWGRRPYVLAVHLSFDYHRPVPLGRELHAVGWLIGEGTRSLQVRGEIRDPEGRLLVSGQGTFAHAPEVLARMAGERAEGLSNA